MPAESLVVAVQGRDGLRIPRGTDRFAVDERAFVLTLPAHAGDFAALSGRAWSPVKNVLIVGCGNIGFHLARELEAQAIFPTILEKDRERAEWVAARLSSASLVLHADGSNPEVLRERVEDDQTDAVVVLVDDDERSLFLGLFAKSLGARKIISRCDQAAYDGIANALGVDATISPRRSVANAILRHVRRGRVGSTVMLGDHEGEIIELEVPARPRHEALVERPLRELAFPRGALLGAVIRNGSAFIADGSTVLQPGDHLLIVTLLHALHDVEKLLS
jgi:trk system potassium uptake protein TrkA